MSPRRAFSCATLRAHEPAQQQVPERLVLRPHGLVFLAPILLLTGWADAKQTAGAASLFILVNSAAGLIGQLTKGVYVDWVIFPLLVAVLLGGQLGSRLGAYHIPAGGVRRLVGAVIVVVGVRIIWGAI